MKAQPAAVALALLIATAPSSAATRYAGRPLADVLNELQHRGLNVIYSSAVVLPTLIVAEEPRATRPRAVLDEILRPLGLQAKSGAGGSILIVPAPPPPQLVERIVVTPGRHDIGREELGPVQSLDHDGLAAAPVLGNDPARTVTLLPGIAANEGSAAFHARGSATKDVSLILDGLELYDPFHLSAFQSPFSTIDGRILDSIAYLSGGFTADRGDRNGGFVEMSSTAPADTAATEVEAGTLNSRVAHQSPTNIGPLLVSARYWYPEATGDTIAFGRDGFRPTFGDFYAKLGLAATATTTVTGHALLATDRATLSESDGIEQVSASNRSGTVWFRILRSWSPRVSSDSVVSAGVMRRARSGMAEPDDVATVVRDERSVSYFGAKHDQTWSVGRSQIVRAGFDARLLRADLSHAAGPAGAETEVMVEPSGASIAAYAAYRAEIEARRTAPIWQSKEAEEPQDLESCRRQVAFLSAQLNSITDQQREQWEREREVVWIEARWEALKRSANIANRTFWIMLALFLIALVGDSWAFFIAHGDTYLKLARDTVSVTAGRAPAGTRSSVRGSRVRARGTSRAPRCGTRRADPSGPSPAGERPRAGSPCRRGARASACRRPGGR
jgi:hypothetical protein